MKIKLQTTKAQNRSKAEKPLHQKTHVLSETDKLSQHQNLKKDEIQAKPSSFHETRVEKAGSEAFTLSDIPISFNETQKNLPIHGTPRAAGRQSFAGKPWDCYSQVFGDYEQFLKRAPSQREGSFWLPIMGPRISLQSVNVKLGNQEEVCQKLAAHHRSYSIGFYRTIRESENSLLTGYLISILEEVTRKADFQVHLRNCSTSNPFYQPMQKLLKFVKYLPSGDNEDSNSFSRLQTLEELVNNKHLEVTSIIESFLTCSASLIHGILPNGLESILRDEQKEEFLVIRELSKSLGGQCSLHVEVEREPTLQFHQLGGSSSSSGLTSCLLLVQNQVFLAYNGQATGEALMEEFVKFSNDRAARKSALRLPCLQSAYQGQGSLFGAITRFFNTLKTTSEGNVQSRYSEGMFAIRDFAREIVSIQATITDAEARDAWSHLTLSAEDLRQLSPVNLQDPVAEEEKEEEFYSPREETNVVYPKLPVESENSTKQSGSDTKSVKSDLPSRKCELCKEAEGLKRRCNHLLCQSCAAEENCHLCLLDSEEEEETNEKPSNVISRGNSQTHRLPTDANIPINPCQVCESKKGEVRSCGHSMCTPCFQDAKGQCDLCTIDIDEEATNQSGQNSNVNITDSEIVDSFCRHCNSPAGKLRRCGHEICDPCFRIEDCKICQVGCDQHKEENTGTTSALCEICEENFGTQRGCKHFRCNECFSDSRRCDSCVIEEDASKSMVMCGLCQAWSGTIRNCKHHICDGCYDPKVCQLCKFEDDDDDDDEEEEE
mmetsp:Transcript_57430/g.65515  ORF Transcript_57430/g.65515 Transcript_57430/m.65515 type:complete len:774 (+) Transcript_57430:40-2361(+)